MSSSFEFTYELGCRAAQADAKHDFKGAFTPADIQQSVSSITSTQGTQKCDVKPQNEDSFLSQSILNTGSSLQKIKESIRTEVSASRYAGVLPNAASIFSPEITNYYSVYYANRPGSADDEDPEKDKEKMKDVYNEIKKDVTEGKLIPAAGTSQVQQALLKAGIRDNVFIICDVVYSALRKDLTFAGRPIRADTTIVADTDKVGQTFYWLQTPQTQYDPGPKSNIESDKGYGWKTEGSNFKFAWQNIVPSMGGRRATVYNPWPNNEAALSKKSAEYPEAMICTNHRMVMSVNCPVTDAIWNYKKHDAVLLFVDPNTNRMTYANKALASKKPKRFSLSSIMSFFGAKASQLVKGTFEQILGKSLSSYTATDFSTKYQILAKRCGDMPQALACLQDSIPYCLAKDPKKKMSNENVKYLEGDGIPQLSNGNHMYASYDRIAIAQALNYRVPLVYFDQPGGNSIIFVAKKLTTVCQRLDNVANEPDAVVADANDLSREDALYRDDGTLKSVQSKLEDIDYVLGSLGDLLLSDPNAASNVKSYVEKYSQKGPVIKQINSENAAHALYAQDELLRVYIGSVWCSLLCISSSGSIEADLKSLSTSQHMNTLASECAKLYDSFILQALSVTTDSSLFADARSSQVLRQRIEKGKTTLLASNGGIQGLVSRFEFKTIMASCSDVVKALRDSLQMVPAKFSECSYADDVITNMTRMIDNYDRIKGLLEEKNKLVLGTRVSLNAFNTAYKEGISDIVRVAREASGNIENLVTGIRNEIVRRAPAGILGNIFSLQPCAYSLVQVRAQRAAPDIDELQTKFGKAFYQIRDARFQIETLISPLWKTISDSSLGEKTKSHFSRILLAFTNRVSNDDKKVNYSEAMKALAGSCNKRLIDLFDVDENEPVVQKGGAVTSIGTSLANLESANASIASGMVSPEQQISGANAALNIDGFVRVFGSLLFSNVLVTNSYFTSVINEGESETITLPKIGNFTQEQLFEGVVRYAVGEEIDDVGSNVIFTGDYQNANASTVFLFNALSNQFDRAVSEYPVLESIAKWNEISFDKQLQNQSVEVPAFTELDQGTIRLLGLIAENPYALRKNVMEGLGVVGQVILPNFVSDYTYGNREAVPLGVSQPIAQPVTMKRLIPSSDDEDSDAETVDPVARVGKRVRVGGKTQRKRSTNKKRSNRNTRRKA